MKSERVESLKRRRRAHSIRRASARALSKWRREDDSTTSHLDQLNEDNKGSIRSTFIGYSESNHDWVSHSPSNLLIERRGSESNRRMKSRRPSSLTVLREWLDLQDDDAREAYWQGLRFNKYKVSGSMLPTVLIQHIRVFQIRFSRSTLLTLR